MALINTSFLRDHSGNTLEPKWRCVGVKRLKRQMSVNETKRLSFNAETKAQRLTASDYRTGSQLHVVSVLNQSFSRHFLGL